tara:strand:- start:432 stop:686 length:255 start_codon:yes stop_codon:yes gene_type:complete
MNEKNKLITEKDIVVGNIPINVIVDGCQATIEIYECTFSERLRINFKNPHTRWGNEFQTKYFEFDGNGKMFWGHEGEIMEIEVL